MSLTNGSNFFKLELRDLLNIVVVLGLGVGFLLTRESASTRQGTNLTSLTSSFQQLSSEIKAMNDKGTTGSQLAIKGLQDVQAAQERRIGKQEDTTAQISQTLTDVQTKLNVIAALLEGKKRP